MTNSNLFSGKTVLLGVTGGIAAYKAAELTSRLIKLGAQVQVVMTQAATKFITPLTLERLSGRKVVTEMFQPLFTPSVEHISFADEADICIIAPASANMIGKIASGIADDMLSTTVMALRCPCFIVPSMNVHMLENPIVQRNIGIIQAAGWQTMEAAVGHLACGYEGKGRMPEPQEIIDFVQDCMSAVQDYAGKRMLVTAGPTRAYLDPVRYITNKSSGKMGYAIAAQAAKRGAQVTLISGPVSLSTPDGVHRVDVETNDEMLAVLMHKIEETDIVIKCAAVLDFKPEHYSDQKIKKTGEDISFSFAPATDILKTLGETKKPGQLLIGFAAETENFMDNASDKLKKKNLDAIVLNDVSRSDAGFGVDNNCVKIIMKDGSIVETDLRPKTEIADIILDQIMKLAPQK